MVKKRIYETLFIISPDLEDEQRDEVAERIKTFIEERMDGTIKTLERWGKRRLAYRVRKGFYEGDYTLILFEADPEKVIDLEKYYKIIPEIFRWQTFRREDLEKAESKKEENKAEIIEDNLNAEVAEELKQEEVQDEILSTEAEPKESKTEE